MTFNQAPTSGNESQAPTLEDKIKVIDDQIEEAHMTFDDALVTKLQAEKAVLESQGVAQVINPEENPGSALRAAQKDPSTPPEEIVALDAAASAKFDVTPKVSTETVQEEFPILQDAHVERRKEEIRNNFLKSLAENTPDRTNSFKKIASNVLTLISEEPNYEFKIQEVRDEKAKKILYAIDGAKERIEDNCLPNPEYLEEVAKAFGTDTEDIKAKSYQAIRNRLSDGDFNPAIFNTLISSDSVENKKESLRKLISKSATNPGNY